MLSRGRQEDSGGKGRKPAETGEQQVWGQGTKGEPRSAGLERGLLNSIEY